MHVRDQIVSAVVESLRGAISEAGSRVYPHGSVTWDRRSYPMLVVTAAKTRVDVEPGTGDRIQSRETEIVVEIHDLETEGADYAERVGAISIQVEKILADLPDAVPVDSASLLSDTGVVEIDEDERGIHAGSALTFGVSYFTRVGDATKLVIP